MGVAHRCHLLGCARRFQMLCQRVNNSNQGASFEPVLLGSTPALRCVSSATGRCLCQILADMIKIAQEGRLLAKNFLGLKPNPFGSIAQRMDLTVKSSACPMCTVAPTPPHFSDFTKGGGVERVSSAQAPSGCQSDFLPLPRLFAGATSRHHCAQHAAVGLGNDIRLTHRRQSAERFLILLLEELFCPAGMVERG